MTDHTDPTTQQSRHWWTSDVVIPMWGVIAAGLIFLGTLAGIVAGRNSQTTTIRSATASETTTAITDAAPSTTRRVITSTTTKSTAGPKVLDSSCVSIRNGVAEPCTSSPTTTAASVPQPTTRPATTQPAGPTMTKVQQQAVAKAQQYLTYVGGFSRIGLIDQLKYSQFSDADATFAVDYLNIDWYAQAAEKAQQYLDYVGGFSCQGLIDQLEYSDFTTDQATYGAQHVGLCP